MLDPKRSELCSGKYLRAKQNAERLHGVTNDGDEQSASRMRIPYFWTNSLAMQKKQYLDSLVEKKQLTADGRDWLTLALDPFHDYNHQVAGYPDADCSQTVVSCYQYQYDLSAPAGQTVNWDAHIYNGCVGKADSLTVQTLDANWAYMIDADPAQPATWKHAPLVIQVQPIPGAPFSPADPATTNPTVYTLPPIDNTDVTSGITRVIGMGFEIHNTTADIYKQGTATCYRMPQMGSQYQMRTGNHTQTMVGSVVGEMRRQPPGTVAQANMLKGTRTWSAAEGAYCTCLQNSVHNPLKQLESQQYLYISKSAPDANSTVVTASAYDTLGADAVAPNASVITFEPNQSIPFDVTGVFLTGLSKESTLTIKLKIYVERAPTWYDSALSVLASPSAGYDVKALELYAMAANQLPPGVKVNENSAGDWWRAVVSIIKNAAPAIGMALNPVLPGAQYIGQGVGKLASIADNTINKVIDTTKGMSVSKQIVRKNDRNRSKKVQKANT